MTNKETWKRLQDLRKVGWEISKHDLNAVRPNSGSETLEHWSVKAVLSQALIENGATIATEATHAEKGQVDVLDLGVGAPRAVAYELERGSQERKAMKLKQYLGPVVQECIIVDPRDAPGGLGELKRWCDNKCLA